MKQQYLFMLIGVLTLISNIAITLHIISRYRNANCKSALYDGELITFKLSGTGRSEGDTTAAVAYDDTIPLE